LMLTVTHEMRSPLSAIKDYARKISGLDDATDESKRYADLIVDTSKGLTSMIDSFLVYSKLANGKATVKERPFRMMDIAEQLKMEYEPFAAKKQLELSVNNKADGVVNGDKEKVLTIGRNLLSNAIKYTGKGEIVLSTTYKNGVFMLMVKDTGTGLDDKQQKQIFKEFARLGNAVTQPGFGLGLSIVKNLVSLMKGKNRCVQSPRAWKYLYH
jgi:two-component system sensor histidine kinase EvgS